MFGYLRLFAIASFIAVLVIAGLVGMYFRAQVGGNLISLGEKNAIAASAQFNTYIWQKHRAELATGTASTAFRDDVNRFITDTRLVALRVYNAGGLLLFTSGGTLSSTAFNENVTAAQADVNRALSRVIEPDADGIAAQGKALRSFLPSGSEAYLEVYTDITREWNRLAYLQWIASGSVVLVFLILAWVLMLVSRKAEGIIAKQHEANMELAAAAASAETASREKSQFLANISHELRTPLNAIIGFSEIIKSDADALPDRYRDYIGDIHGSGVHLLSLINDILDFSKAEAGKLDADIQEMNATKMISNCLRLVSPRAESAGVQLINAMPREPIVIHTDTKRFKQVLLNLLSNAVKFTPQGGRVRINAWLDEVSGMYMFEIADSGIGIAPKDIARAMAPFGQVDNALSRKYDGTGLGLPLTKKFIEHMGGKFMINSEAGIGTTITFSLPKQFPKHA